MNLAAKCSKYYVKKILEQSDSLTTAFRDELWPDIIDAFHQNRFYTGWKAPNGAGQRSPIRFTAELIEYLHRAILGQDHRGRVGAFRSLGNDSREG